MSDIEDVRMGEVSVASPTTKKKTNETSTYDPATGVTTTITQGDDASETPAKHKPDLHGLAPKPKPTATTPATPAATTPVATTPAKPAAASTTPAKPAAASTTPANSVAAQDTAMKTFAQGAEGAAANRQVYDAATAAAMAGGPAAAMERQNAAAREEAQRQSDMAIQQSIRGAKTAGMMGGQAALAAQGQAANAYGTGMAQGQQQYAQNLNLGAQLGESMANRLFSAGQGQAGVGASQLGAQTANYATQQQAAAAKQAANQQMIGNIIGTVGGIAGLFSDRRLKEDTRPVRISDSLEKIKGYTYKYKGSKRPEAGVMAQDLEKTAMAPAVMDTPEGKMVDTRRLSTMNTAALAEHEKRMQAIEKMLKGMGEMQ